MIDITDEAFKWFQEELDISPNESVQFYVRYGGCGNFQSGFSLALMKKAPEDPAIKMEKENVLFYIEKQDEWYFEGKDFLVDFNKDRDEIQFLHNKTN